MITIENYLGKISISEDYLVSLISYTASGCFGVANLNPAEGKTFFSAILRKTGIKGRRGVKISVTEDNKLNIILHISVLYGTNISAVTESLAHKIRYTIEDRTGLAVSRLSVFVDGMLD
ncbi:MAG: Asp23/Gls24 family envelope stress response protein [Oscillospiraceae bacterium]|nr:Asp23/Gls24 family envelope stress response protein [Oscillospiraceae bacterium]